MKKNIILIASIFSTMVSAQGADAINKIYPAAPTSNNLMKFEEVPVSYYTGVPDINIPIYTLSGTAIQVPVSLNYHILSAKPDDYASQVGLGWNLIAGGTIARTVKGLPDEAIKDNLGGGKQGIGIYIDEYSNHPNFADNYRNRIASYLDMISNGGNPFIDSYFRKTGFEAAVSNRYDTQYDLYQYNFLGHTGRFIIKKDSGNQFQVVKLDKNNLKITSQHNNKYEPISFTIIDERGRKYIFDVIEKTQRSFMVDKVSQLSNMIPQTSIGQIDDYNSSFHLSSIKNDLEQELAGFQYNAPQDINVSSTSRISNFPIYATHYEDNINQQIDPYLPPKSQVYTTNTLNKTRLLQRINITNGGKIDFIYKRNNTDFGAAPVPHILSEIQVKDNYEKVIEKFSFTYQPDIAEISLLDRKKIKLTDIIKKNTSNNVLSKYKLNYYPGTGEKDYWGYEISSDGGSNGSLLSSITYPTSGKTEFNYEGNTFSYVGTSFIDYKLNIYNWKLGSEGVSYTKFKEPEKYFFKMNREQDVYFSYYFSALPNTDWRLELFKGDGTIVSHTPEYFIGTLWNNISASEGVVKLHLPAGHYYARLDTDDAGAMFQNFSPVSIVASYSELKTEDIEYFLYGGGVRIGRIRYLDSDDTLLKQKSFSYSDPSDPMVSSGSLISLPMKEYETNFNTNLWYTLNYSWYDPIYYNNSFKVKSSDNLLPILKTKGADIGYEYVTMFETGKGKTINQYKTARLYPNEETMSSSPPFLPITDEDYKRGHMVKEEIKDENNVTHIEKKLDYETNTSTLYTGLLFNMDTQNPYLGEFDTYDDFMYHKQNCGTSFSGLKCSKIQDVSDFPIQYKMERTILAGVNHTNTETKEFFGNSYSLKKEKTVYNTLDLPVKTAVTFSDNSVSETIYQYAHEKNNQRLINANIIGVPLEVATIRKESINDTGKTISKVETKYDNPSNQYPSSIVSYGLQNSALVELNYDKYDELSGNLQQYTSKDGISTTIIWGYNQTQPIAKIEGAKLSDISQTLIDGIVNASANDAQAGTSASEQSLISALDLFRNNSALSGYQITTYSYDPLIGVTSITPPSGIREVYIYDTANRLMEIRENSTTGKILKEFKYNYKQ
ncbi:hypothetical protein ACKW6Q_09895 [Chryseobacterium kwangjuense]|uniref:YD repeat-containing protein n=1 Tax=Chryseobacterium kwangjuense TaxID=267125 RepID=A0ABW9K491_9FLAO